MRVPRHDIILSLPAGRAIAEDEALLDQLQPRDARLERWWVAVKPAVVVGLGLHHQLASVVDLERCRAAGVEVLHRRAGGGALLVDEHMLCGAVCVPIDAVPSDVTESYRWLGDELTAALNECGVPARRVDVAEARADVAALRSSGDVVSRLLLSTCYGALSPHEVVVGQAKVVGLAQVRRRHAALFQFGILLRSQSPLADYLMVDDDDVVRERLRAELQKRTVGLRELSRQAC
jgi:lipoate---protein ligase